MFFSTLTKTDLLEICKTRCSRTASDGPLQMALSFFILANNSSHESHVPSASYKHTLNITFQ